MLALRSLMFWAVKDHFPAPLEMNTVFVFTAYMVDFIVICLINLGYFTFHFLKNGKKRNYTKSSWKKNMRICSSKT